MTLDDLYCDYRLLLMYVWAVYRVFTNIKIGNQAEYDKLALQEGFSGLVWLLLGGRWFQTCWN